MSGSPRDPAVAVVVLVNRRAKRLAEEGPLLAALREPRAGVTVVETSSLEALEEAARAIAREPADAVVLAGGDGSYMAGVSALSLATEGALPPIALAPGGTASTVARNWGFAGGGLLDLRALRGGADAAAARYTRRLLDAVTRGVARSTARPSLRVTDDHGSRVGFIAGTGLVARFFEVYEEDGARGYAGAARIVARVFAGSLAGGALAHRVLSPMPCAIEIDGAIADFDRTSLLCASVVRDLGLGIRLLYRAGESFERFHVVATPLGPGALGPQLPLVLAGRPLLGRRRVDALARALSLRFPEGEGAYVLDGELIRSDRVEITAGPRLRILSL